MAGVRFRGLWEETVLNNAEQQFLNDLDNPPFNMKAWNGGDIRKNLAELGYEI